MINIQEPAPTPSFALLNLGFRPFFLLASSFASISMLLWVMMYFDIIHPLPDNLNTRWWHGHEMVFGYAMAVIAGFLLTAVGNWTNQQTASGFLLAGIACLWLLARVAPFTGITDAIWLMAMFDLAFMCSFIIAITYPIVKTQQWGQLGIIAKVILMFVANSLFYLGLLEVTAPITVQWGLYLGLYLVLSLILMMGRRVIPFFIERSVDEKVTLTNWKWLDISSLILFVAFMLIEVFWQLPLWSSLLAGLLFALHTFRLINWYTHGIWKKPLLWVLYLGYGFMVLGFALATLEYALSFSPWLAIHSFAAGGIGMITCGMMSRVSLGHTGRNVFSPPSILSLVFFLLLLGAIIRVLLPLILPAFYTTEILLSQLLWIVAFALFTVTYAPMLSKPRVDGQPG
jgi:uncharacterized protein involved in response to NO